MKCEARVYVQRIRSIYSSFVASTQGNPFVHRNQKKSISQNRARMESRMRLDCFSNQANRPRPAYKYATNGLSGVRPIHRSHQEFTHGAGGNQHHFSRRN